MTRCYVLLMCGLLATACGGDAPASEALCGNGMIEPGETCDGSCLTFCDDSNPCTRDLSTAGVNACDVACSYEPIAVCQDGDGCCPAGCAATNDADCAPLCGNRVVEPGETCDGNCVTHCNDGSACTQDTLVGSAQHCDSRCEYDPVAQCVGGDGCCPAGCGSQNDSDCSARCGNSLVEPPEACDGNCPQSCDDANPCTGDQLVGSAVNCSAQCVYSTVNACLSGDGCCPAGCNANADTDCSSYCGNGIVEPGETCDAGCPFACDDGNSCTQDSLQGAAGQCDAQCLHDPITACQDADGCCAPGCNAMNDSDCPAICGNGVAEGSEACDGTDLRVSTCGELIPETIGIPTCLNSCQHAEWMCCSDEDWLQEVVHAPSSLSYWIGRWSSLAVDSSDQPHVAYHSGEGDGLRYAIRTTGGWQYQIVDVDGRNSSLALDANDRGHIVYFSGYELRYAHFDGSVWQLQTVDASGYPNHTSDIALDLKQAHKNSLSGN